MDNEITTLQKIARWDGCREIGNKGWRRAYWRKMDYFILGLLLNSTLI
jgi:hypothetical protein